MGVKANYSGYTQNMNKNNLAYHVIEGKNEEITAQQRCKKPNYHAIKNSKF